MILFKKLMIKNWKLLAILMIAMFAVYGWMSGNLIYASYSIHYVPIAPSNISIVLLLSLLIILNSFTHRIKALTDLTSLLLLIILLYCLFIFIQYFLKISTDVESIFIKTPQKMGNILTGRMSPLTSFLYLLICMGYFGLKPNISNRLKYIGGIISLFALVMSSVLFLGYILQAPLLYGGTFIPVSLPSTICFILFSLTLLQDYEKKFYTLNILRPNKVALMLLKSFLPISAFIVIIQALMITRLHFTNENFTLSIAFILISVLIVTIILIYRISSRVGNQIHQLNNELKELNADKDRFISIIGHDLKGPFTSLMGFTDLLSKEVNHLNNDKVKIYTEVIRETSINTYNLLNEILTWANSKQGKIPYVPKILNFRNILNTVTDIINPNALSKNIEIDTSEILIKEVYADPEMLGTILRNLISNAIKFTKRNGKIWIKLEQIGEKALISVSDNGIGIPHKNMARLFDISQVLTTPGTENEHGTGLGLLLCKDFVEKHGGEIWIKSEPGLGSTVSFTLPKVRNNRLD
jgi:signal transduction histidine kinase